MHDVYAYGVVAPSTLFELSDDFPAEGGYAEIAGVFPSLGGEAAGGAYVLARLGIATKLAGNRLGGDKEGERVLDLLTNVGVDCSAIGREHTSRSVTEVVFVTAGARTVFGTYGRLTADLAWDGPSEDDIRSSRIVCLDPFFLDESQQAADWCLEADIPYVTVDTSPDSEIAAHAEALIISEEFATRTLATSNLREVLATYTDRCRGLVIVTQGGEPLLYGRENRQQMTYSPGSIAVRDTTGAGDSFRAGIIYGMLKGYGDDELIRTASAVAALVCQRLPGVLGSPSEHELEVFLASLP